VSRFLPLGIVGLCCALVQAWTSAAEPWDAPAFTVSAKSIAEAARELEPPEEFGFDVLLNETSLQFDEQGRCARTYRVVYRVLNEPAAESAGIVEATWAPWYQERPTLKARVITAKGDEHLLDEKHIAEVPADQQQDVLTDRRRLRAPLAGVHAGAVIERQIVLRDVRPFFEQGTTDHVEWNTYFPQRLIRLTINAPEKLPLRHQARGCEVEPVRTKSADRVNLVFQASDVPARKTMELLQPPQVPRTAQIVISTAESWESVARGYQAIVEKQLAGADVKALVADVVDKQLPRETAIAKLLERLQASVRYTALAFGEAAIVPRPPAETITRHFGDCKDQSALLVAMLRAAGIKAHVALLHTGSMEEIATDLPGLGAFNHAIVYVPGEPAMWIDPTAPFARAGELPLLDENKPALVVSEDSKGLLRTPESPSKNNRYVQTQEIDLTNPAAVKVKFALESSGTIEQDRRAGHAQQTSKAVRKQWEDFLKQGFGIRTLDKFSCTEPRDLAGPFKIEVEGGDAKANSLEEGAFSMTFRPSELVDYLPALFHPPLVRKTPESDAAEEAVRKTPLYLLQKHVCELNYRYLPPAGFIVQELPESKEFKVGPAQLSRKFEVEPSGALSIRFQLDTGDGNFKPAELAEFRTALGEIVAGNRGLPWNFAVVFELTSARDSRAGRHREALAELRRLRDKQPEDGSLQLQYALALLRAGMGEPARAEARRAAELAPKSAGVWHYLGAILTYDTLGRHFRPGMDWAGAKQAYEKGMELDPQDEVLAFDHAILLEHDAAGDRFSSDVDQQACLAAYRAAHQKFPANELLRQNYLVNLLDCGQYEELAKQAAKKPHTLTTQSLLLAAVAVEQGTAAGKKRAEALQPDVKTRRNVLLIAGDYLQRSRQYSLATEYWTEGAKGNPNEARVQNLIEKTSKVKLFDDLALPADKPESVVQQVYFAQYRGGQELRDARRLFTNPPEDGEIEELRLLGRELSSGINSLKEQQVHPQRRADLLANSLELTAEGDDQSGYRVQAAGPTKEGRVWFVVKREDEYKILSVGESLDGLAAEALRALDAEQTDRARQCLKWAYQHYRDEVNFFDVYSGRPFARLWTMLDTSKPDDLRLAAAALLAMGDRREEAAKTLLADREAQTDKRRTVQIDRALLFEYQDRDLSPGCYEIMLAAADRILASSPKAVPPLMRKVRAMIMLGRPQEALALLRKRAEETPKDRGLKHLLGMALAECGEFTEALEVLRTMPGGKPTLVIESAMAWDALFLNPVPEEALEQAKHSVEEFPTRDGMHALAALYAEFDKPKEAQETLLRGLQTRGGTLDHADNYILGRIAECYGLPKTAAEYYGRVQKEPHKGEESTWHVAQRRLKLLEAK
jgi:Flp pilus assembly protein TadD/transglutaminase-like putative cysteine protease